MKRTYRKFALWIFCGWAAAFMIGSAQAGSTSDTQSLITSWNVCSKQFIDPPVFTLLPLPGAAEYRAEVTQEGKIWSVSSRTPSVGLAKIWRRLSIQKFQLRLVWLDGAGKVLHEEKSQRVKAPDFKGLKEPPMDWAAAADRNIAYLIDAAANAPAPYREPGVPVWIWAATKRLDLGYPCITVNNMIWAFLACVECRGKDGPHGADAMRLARTAADWMLQHRQPETGALPLFPFSTVTHGKFGGAVEGDAVNLLRASWLGISFVDLYEATGHVPYLDYARHIADTTVKFQNADGSFPYRVHPVTGAVIEQYNANAMEFVELVEKLEPHGHDARRTLAARRTVEWLLAYVCATNNWKAAYEDAGETRFYTNLSQMGAQPLIRYLCRHKDENPAWLPTARRLNRWVEDQFVLFGPDDEASPVRDKGPLVFEQFICWWPMEGHTANWILTLIELHKATGERQYLDKARAAANAICRDQYPNGEFSTWGRDWQTGKTATPDPNNPGFDNWYNASAFADWALYKLTVYMRTLKRA